MKIELLELEKILLYEDNCKLHPDWQLEQIKDSIKEFGYNDPIAIDEKNIIIEGHGRYLALKELGYKKVEVIRLSHLSQIQKEAYIIMHNKSCMSTGFDPKKLAKAIEGLQNKIDLSLTGFSDFELEEIIGVDTNDIDLDNILSDIPKEENKEPKRCPHCGGIL